MPLQAGSVFDHYRVVGPIGRGGMGEVYRAYDERLERDVAIKVLPESLAQDPEARERFEREAKTIAALSHPNILTIHDYGTAGEVSYAVTEMLQGENLQERATAGEPVAWQEVLEIALALAEGLAAAHARHIVHRDIKPSNIFLSDEGETIAGRLKILDFGLARSELLPDATDEKGETLAMPTSPGTVLGTVGYMSPEQARGQTATPASDVFSVGCVLYELLAGAAPFERGTRTDSLAAVLQGEPAALEPEGGEGARKVSGVVMRCLAKEPSQRFASAAELRDALRQLRDRYLSSPRSFAAGPRTIATAVAVVALVGLAAWFLVTRGAERRWARGPAIAEIEDLVEHGDFAGAFALAQRVAGAVPDHPELEALLDEMSAPVDIRTEPPGARVSYKLYRDVAGEWTTLGTTPISGDRLPLADYRWRIDLDGFEPREVARRLRHPDWRAQDEITSGSGPGEDSSRDFFLELEPEGSTPEGMVPVAAGRYRIVPLPGIPLGTVPPPFERYWIDSTEVTNAAFAEFIKAGGYERQDLWQAPFGRDGEVLSWEQAMALVRDSTGRPGPSTWVAGRFEAGQEELPVGGVSWFEAAAYCRYAGKELPTIFHWVRAALPSTEINDPLSPAIVALSNFGNAPAAVAESNAISLEGAFDMAGNVREWTVNASGRNRLSVGGGFGEPSYTFNQPQPRSPWSRDAVDGIRCVRYSEGSAIAELAAPLERREVDFDAIEPQSEETFLAVKRLLAYQRTPLNAVVDSKETLAEGGTEEWVSLDAAYGGERLLVRLQLPAGVEPPFQPIVWFPGASAYFLRNSKDAAVEDAPFFLVQSGRALIKPVYSGFFERNDGTTLSRIQSLEGWNEIRTQWLHDLGRTLDYLEQRDDIDAESVGYLGFSLGAAVVPGLLPFEDRVRAVALWSGALGGGSEQGAAAALGGISRLQVPLLMINGSHDYVMSPAGQEALFKYWGAPEENKHRVVFDAGHWPYPRNELIRETLDFFDRYLGPVR